MVCKTECEKAELNINIKGNLDDKLFFLHHHHLLILT